jgi:hypothetical protein
MTRPSVVSWLLGPNVSAVRVAMLGIAFVVTVPASLGCCSAFNRRAQVIPATITNPATLPGGSITDVYMFPSPTNAANVVLVMNFHPLIPPGQGLVVTLDPNILYTLRMDTSGDLVEDLVIQVKATGAGSNQVIQVSGPVKPSRTGTAQIFETPDQVVGTLNTPFTLSNGARVFAGAAEDPFFFDLNAFYSMLPDRAALLGPTFTNINGVQVPTTPANPNALQLTSFRPAGSAQDFFKGFNVLSIVVELPRTALGGGTVRLWATTAEPRVTTHSYAGGPSPTPRPTPVGPLGPVTNATSAPESDATEIETSCGSSSGPTIFTQVCRQGRPLTSTVFPTVANKQQSNYDVDIPADDAAGNLGTEVQAFMTQAAGRSQAVAAAAKALLTPDVLVADLSQSGSASYLGIETIGPAGGRSFGGRALTDDVVDTTFSIIFGSTLPRLGLASDDGKETPALTTDNVGVNTAPKHFQSTFPYVGPPQ